MMRRPEVVMTAIPDPVGSTATACSSTTLMPSPLKTVRSRWASSGSARGARHPTTLTLAPRWAKSWACSIPTYPPPITTIDGGTSSSSIAVVDVKYSTLSKPGSSGMAGSAPVATR